MQQEKSKLFPNSSGLCNNLPTVKKGALNSISGPKHNTHISSDKKNNIQDPAIIKDHIDKLQQAHSVSW